MTAHPQPAPRPGGVRPPDRFAGFVAYNARIGGAPDLTGPKAARRLARLNELDLIGEHEEWDSFAHMLAKSAQELLGLPETPVAMVNFLTDQEQFFAGLHVPAPVVPDSVIPAGGQMPRSMPLDYGGCPHVVAEGKALVLDDVCAWRGFWGNPVVDQLGIRSYLGAPVPDTRTGIILGTVCVIDREVRPWGRPGWGLIKERAAALAERIHERERPAPT
jgi:GAF domain-containing protein